MSEILKKLLKSLNNKNYKKEFNNNKIKLLKITQIKSPNSSELFSNLEKTEFSLGMYYNFEINKILNPKLNIKKIISKIRKLELSEKNQKLELILIVQKLEIKFKEFETEILFLTQLRNKYHLKLNSQSELFKLESLIQLKKNDTQSIKDELNHGFMVA